MAERVAVLLVCTGNICRSPTAEGVLRHLVEKRGLADRITIESAGTHDYHVGEGPDPRTVRHASKRGYDLTALRAAQVSPADFQAYELLPIVDEFATGWDDLPELILGRPHYRLLITTGYLVPMISVVGQLGSDGAVELTEVSVDLRRLEP